MSATKNGNGHEHDNGHVVKHITRKTSPLRFCMNQDCRKYMPRSNRFRLWKFTVGRDNSELPKFQKADIVLCLDCFNNRQLGKMINLAGGPALLPSKITRAIGFNK